MAQIGRNMAMGLAGWTPPPGVTPGAASAMAALMQGWGNPLNIISAYRDPARNAKVGGAKRSQHMHGNAFDVDVANMPREQRLALIEQARQAGFKGIGVYDNSLHFDVGPERAWGPDYSRNSLPEWAAGAVSGAGGVTGGNTTNLLDSAIPALPPSILDQTLPPREGPDTLADMEAERAKAAFLPGVGLQSLGAAIAAGSQGASAAEALANIRKNYYAEEEAEYEKKMEAVRRNAAVVMVGGPDTPLGRALVEGADVDQVMQTYTQERALQHQGLMQERGFGHDAVMQEDSQAHAAGMQQAGFGHDTAMQQAGFGHDATMQDQRLKTERDLQQGRLTYGTREREASQEFQSQESEKERGARLYEFETARLDELNTLADEMERSGVNGATVKARLAAMAERHGDAKAAAEIRAAPDSAFSEPSVVQNMIEAMESAPTPDEMTSRMANFAFVEQRAAEIERTEGKEAADKFRKYMLDQQAGTSVSVNTGELPGYGKLDPGYAYVLGDDGMPVKDANGKAQVYAIPGSKAYNEEQAAAAEQRATAEQAASRDSSQLSNSSNVLRAIDSAIEGANSLSAGLLGQVTQSVGGSPARTLAGDLSTIGANIAFNELAKMRAASPTGGALGSIAVEELRLLQATIASIDQGLPPEKLKENLKYIRDQYLSYVERINASNASDAEKRAALLALGVQDPSPSSSDGWIDVDGARVREKR